MNLEENVNAKDTCLKFNIGDTVYAVLSGYKQVDCNFCEGTGKLELLNGGIVLCPTCRGNGKKTSDETYIVDTYSFVVGIIQITADGVVLAEMSDSMNPMTCNQDHAYKTEAEALSMLEV